MQLMRCLLSNFYLNRFQASLCPSSGEQDRVLLHMVYCTDCAGCGCVELGRKLCAAPHNHSQHNQCRTPYAVIHGLVLLMMVIMMPETCWDRSLIINIGLVASCWFISVHPWVCVFSSTGVWHYVDTCQRCMQLKQYNVNAGLCS